MFLQEEKQALDVQVNTLCTKSIVVPTQYSQCEFISNIFPHPKPNGEVRLILDLTLFNDFIEYKHFKMFSLETAQDLKTPNSWLASVDLKDAYYTILIIQHHRKCLRFFWKGQLYKFTCLPNRLACTPRLFTTILKPIFSKNVKHGTHNVFIH